eukprot:1422689-Rhodomonas_salina.1
MEIGQSMMEVGTDTSVTEYGAECGGGPLGDWIGGVSWEVGRERSMRTLQRRVGDGVESGVTVCCRMTVQRHGAVSCCDEGTD